MANTLSISTLISTRIRTMAVVAVEGDADAVVGDAVVVDAKEDVMVGVIVTVTGMDQEVAAIVAALEAAVVLAVAVADSVVAGAEGVVAVVAAEEERTKAPLQWSTTRTSFRLWAPIK